jgi:hypothetical protein
MTDAHIISSFSIVNSSIVLGTLICLGPSPQLTLRSMMVQNAHHLDMLPTSLESVSSEVFTAVTMKNAFSWDVTPCGSCENRHFGIKYCPHYQWLVTVNVYSFRPDDGSDTFLRNVGSNKIHTAPHPRRRHCS